MIVYRISSSIYSKDLSGVGAGLYGGRWNPVGINLLYTAGSISLTCMEYLVHNMHILKTKPISLSKIKIPDTSSTGTVRKSSLPDDWNEKSYLPMSTQKIGLEFFKSNKHHILKVPSAIVPEEFNYLFNPMHPNHRKIKIIEQIEPFDLDERLFL